MQRFFAGQYFDYRQISRLIFNIFSFDKVQLTLDRTNWKWGKRNINILMLAIVYRGIAIPIVWTLLNKRGNSDTKERIALIQRFISIFALYTTNFTEPLSYQDSAFLKLPKFP